MGAFDDRVGEELCVRSLFRRQLGLLEAVFSYLDEPTVLVSHGRPLV